MRRYCSLPRLAVLSLALAGCGRLGYEPGDLATALPPDVDGNLGNSVGDEPDAGTSPSEGPADGGASDPDAGSDGKGPGKEMYDAGSPADAGTPFEPSFDSDGGPSDSLSCADYPTSLACASFRDAELGGWYIDDRRPGQTPQIYDGILDCRTSGSGSDSYASASFAPLYGGTLYFRMRVMFPSDGELSSVNFITVGNYEDERDYGVELDAIDGNLAFNSSSDGFVYSDFALARDQWLCLDASLVLDGRNGQMSVRVDGVTALEVYNVDTLPAYGTALVDIGIDWTRDYQDFAHVLVDDFVLSREPVTCP